MSKTALEKIELSGELALAGQSEGFEGVGAEDVQVPQLKVAQGLSPEMDKGKGSYIKGLEQGDMFDSVHSHVYGPHVRVIVLTYVVQWLIWLDRDKAPGSTFRGAFSSEWDARQEFNNLSDEERVIASIDRTPQYVLFVCPEEGQPGGNLVAVLPMTKSKQTASKAWMSRLKQAGDIWSNAWSLETASQENAKKQSFQGFKTPRCIGKLDPDTKLYGIAKEQFKLYQEMKKAGLKVDRDDVKDEEETAPVEY